MASADGRVGSDRRARAGASRGPRSGAIQVILPIGGFFEMVVDLDHLHVFVTGDPSLNNSRVVAVDHRGNVVKLFRNEPGAAGMALDPGHSTLYVALQQGDAIAAIDTATLREK